MRVLVTGHAGYLGSVLTNVLRNDGHEVIGLDCGLYEHCDFGRVRESIASLDLDVRDIETVDLIPYDAVIHLAALPDSAWQQMSPETVRSINEEATIRLAESSKKAGVRRFLFASTWRVYGDAHDLIVDEHCTAESTFPLAEMKSRCEQAIEQLADETFQSIILRQAEVYGVSPRMRIDLMVNDFVAAAFSTRKISLAGDGHGWRPIIHIDDLARAYATLLTLRDASTHHSVYNLVTPNESYREIEIADAVTDEVSGSTRFFGTSSVHTPGCRMSGERFLNACPGFRYRWTLPLGIRQLCLAFEHSGFTPSDWRCHRYRRAPHLRQLIETGGADEDLRPVTPMIA